MVCNEPRCIYCNKPSASIEHMPPISLFLQRRRPKGLEFGACTNCNHLTSGADLVASFMARLETEGLLTDDVTREALERKAALEQKAPGLLPELLRRDKSKKLWLRTRTGLFREVVQINADGPLLHAHLTVFAAKMGMALYREHVGSALPMEGGVQTHYFLNSGLSIATAESILAILPLKGGLEQGSFTSAGQFVYRFNCDGRETLAALISFHRGLHIFLVAAANPSFYGMPTGQHGSDFVRPGELVARMPTVPQQNEAAVSNRLIPRSLSGSRART